MIRAYLASVVSAAALALAPAGAASAQDWGTTIAETAGGHRLGNPQAPVKLAAFVSYTCPHCATFEMESDAPLRLQFIQTGQVSLEVHHVIRNAADLAAALSTECGAEDRFWANHRLLMRQQSRWLPRAANLTEAQRARWNAGTLGSRMRAIASDLGFYEIMETRGYSVAELDRCLTDQAAVDSIFARMTADDERWDVTGTPSFAVNGALLANVHSWASLQGHLVPAAD